ncbi:NADPH2 dehydrogenase [Cladophialophora psammophila CBS 110553]|uniref:NADPH2 dehydrogenase n=1 Tax=Cladophialophora psammophila CBS 110553 TaxID=1182543 RepID=W9Y161_9EURO|nr:NADPH2 dehydrogenase [Cladophialophora psammophila CBS 110553]EXJ76234.1 NADPH2 dehydrogenase [Cladophialophora psammophila CBS 110553]
MGSLPISAPSRLFEPLKIGNITLQHRLVMAPLTRFRADDSHVPLPFTTTYYSQRASVPGTLIITEATFISKRAGGYPNVPGIWSTEQIAAWKHITDTVHAKGSYIYLQLWALGRTANPAIAEREGIEIVSSSPTPVDAENPVVPRELSRDEIKGFVADYAQAARNAIEAGFDGVEIHAANGYLIDQFTQDVCNVRTDEYGGSVENRSRFGLEVARAVVDAVGAHRTGIRLSPFSTFQGMKMRDPLPQFTHFMKGLKELKLAYMHLVESRISGNADVEATEKIDPLIDVWDNTSPVLVAGGFKPASARQAVDDEYKDRDIAIVFGRYFISTPDLPFRIANNIELTPYNRDTFYTPKSEVGYIDYSFSNEFEQANTKL